MIKNKKLAPHKNWIQYTLYILLQVQQIKNDEQSTGVDIVL